MKFLDNIHSRQKFLRYDALSRFILFACIFFVSVAANAQYSFKTADRYQQFLQARQWFVEEQYKLAYPVFSELSQQLSFEHANDQQLYREELQFHLLACRLVEGESRAAREAMVFLSAHTPEALKGQLQYYLGHYYFKQQEFEKAITAFENTAVANLSNNQVASMQFAQGYSYFTQKNFRQARPLLQSVKDMPESPQYVDANYYYGLIAFQEGKYRDALNSFEIAQEHPAYASLVPYYSASINYSLGKKTEGLDMAKKALAGGDQYYGTELNLLVGHAYFEQGNFAEALPYLEKYVKQSDAVKRQDLYELAYCYYQVGKFDQAIGNFKPLAGGADSLSQHAMYLLGDLYLKKNDKPNARNAFLFCSTNGTNAAFREISAFNYGKLSYELGYDAEALPVLQQFIRQYPNSSYQTEAQDLLVNVLSNTSNYKEALDIYEGLKSPGVQSKKAYPRILYNRAQQQLSDRRVADAEQMLRKVLAVPYNEGFSPLAHFWLGEIVYAKGQYAESINHYRSYLDAPVRNGEANEMNAWYNMAYGQLMMESYDQARQSFEKAATGIADRSLRYDITARIADCYFMRKQFGDASRQYQNLVDAQAPGADYALYQLGMIAGAQNNSKVKISTLNSIARRYPNSTLVQTANLEIANTFLADEQFNEALPYFDQILKSNATSFKPEALLRQGLAYYNLGRAEQAINSLQSLVKQYPQSEESAVAIETLRTIYVEEGKTQDYLAMMKKLGKNVDDQVADSLMYYAAELQWSDGKKEQALKSFENYVSTYPYGRNAVKANYQVAEIYRTDKKDYAKALKYYDAVMVNAPNAYAERSMLAASRIAYFELKDYKLAAEKYELLHQYASDDNNRFEALRGLVRSYYYSQNYDRAEGSANALVNMPAAGADDKMFAALVLGKAAMNRNDCDAAMPQMKKVVSLNKAEPAAEARYNIALCYLKQQKNAEAEKAAFEVINKSGSYEMWVTKAYILLGDIFMAQKDYFNAKATYQSVAENAAIDELRNEAKSKLAAAEKADAEQSKIGG